MRFLYLLQWLWMSVGISERGSKNIFLIKFLPKEKNFPISFLVYHHGIEEFKSASKGWEFSNQLFLFALINLIIPMRLKLQRGWVDGFLYAMYAILDKKSTFLYQQRANHSWVDLKETNPSKANRFYLNQPEKRHSNAKREPVRTAN